MNRINIILVVTSLLFSACKKQPVKSTTKEHTIQKDTIIPMDVVCVKNMNFNTFSSKAKVDYNDGQNNVNANLNIRIRKDSLIWLSGTMFGIEGIRAMISPDSVWIVNKLEKTYSIFSVKELGQKLNIDLNFSIIQAILIGNTPFEQQQKDKVIRKDAVINLEQVDKGLTILNQINLNNCKLEKLEVKQLSGFGNAEVNYANFNLVNDLLFAFNNTVNISFTDHTGIHKTNMVINHNKIDINDINLKFPFNIPNRYERK